MSKSKPLQAGELVQYRNNWLRSQSGAGVVVSVRWVWGCWKREVVVLFSEGLHYTTDEALKRVPRRQVG